MFIFELKKRSNPNKGPNRPKVSSLIHMLHRIEVNPDEQSCAAAQSLADQRLLSEDAPRLPLNDCQNPSSLPLIKR